MPGAFIPLNTPRALDAKIFLNSVARDHPLQINGATSPATVTSGVHNSGARNSNSAV
jgi:hypothetical protein